MVPVPGTQKTVLGTTLHTGQSIQQDLDLDGLFPTLPNFGTRDLGFMF